jgi:acetylornithine deacetylase/succinyl-diaminopimelate desuccinylase-like protein
MSFSAPLMAQENVRQYIKDHQQSIVRELFDLLSIPNVSGDVPNVRRNAEYLIEMLRRHGMSPESWETSTSPIIFGEKLVPGATRTILFYIHYDGQPIDARRWKQADPFKPILRTSSLENDPAAVEDVASVTAFPDDWRIYARSAADDKGPIEAFVAALDAIGGKPHSNIKVILHGEEEAGGPALNFVIGKYPEKLRSDVLIVLDGPQHHSGRPTIFYGARAIQPFEVTVYTAKQGMHDGNYGNWMPDANVRLAQLISSMVDGTGKAVIDGFYSDVLPFSAEATRMMQAVPDDTAAMQRQYGVGSTSGAASSLQEGLNLPSFSVRIRKDEEVGGVIAASATAQIILRLVKDNSPQQMIDRIAAHIRKQGYYVVESEPDTATLATHPKVAKVTARAGRGTAWRTEPETPEATFVTDALRSVWGDEIVRVRTLGGSVPMFSFIDRFHVPVVGVPLANADDNQHAENENLRLGNLWNGIVTLSAIMTR